MNQGRWIAAAVVLGGLAGGGHADAQGTVADRVDSLIRSPGFGQGHWGLLVVDAKTGQTVYERNPDQLFCPASVTKLFTTAAALADLGEGYRFVTPVVRRGEVDKDGTLQGDLILVASGDLSLGGRTGPDGALLFEDNDHSYANGNFKATLVKADPRAGLNHLAREIRERGIRKVTGEVIVDDRLFQPAASTGSGPSRVVPISVNDNMIDVVVTPGTKPDEPAGVRTVPETAFAVFESRVTTSAEDSQPRIEVETLGARRFAVTGQIPAGFHPVVREFDVADPASFARALFVESLRSHGVTLEASPLADNPGPLLPLWTEVKKLPKVADYTSPPFREYLRTILKVSQNLHASTLPLLIAAHHGETTLEAGLKREGSLIRELGVDPESISFGGGAGGSRADLVSPRATVALLQNMSRRPDFPSYEVALPVLGRDGTLAEAVGAESPARGHVRAKTGTFYVGNGLNGKVVLMSKALAGYLETSSGRPLIFAFFVNNVPQEVKEGTDVSVATAAAGRLLGKICEAIYAE